MEDLLTEAIAEPNTPPKCEYVNAVVFNDAGEALVIEANGSAVGKWGMIEAMISQTDDPLTAVQTALLTQTGYQTQTWNYVGTYLRNSDDLNSAGHIFVALSAKKHQEPPPTPTAHAPRWISREELRYGLLDGRILSFRYALNVALALLMGLEG